MKSLFFKRVKQFFALLFLTTFLSSCVYKNIDGSNNFYSLVDSLVKKTSDRIFENIDSYDVVLVSDFANLKKLQSKSRLGFLLSDTLKDRLLSKNIIVREVELREEFTLGKNGFNMLSRDIRDINNQKIENARYAVVGTYTITTKSLIVFIKLIDMQTGHILTSATQRTPIDEEILELDKSLEENKPYVYSPMVL